MYIFCSDCTVSIVAYREGSEKSPEPKTLIRSRTARDIESFLYRSPVLYTLQHTPQYDYPWRVVIETKHMLEVMLANLEKVYYYNFKDSIRNPWRKVVALKVWSEVRKGAHLIEEFDIEKENVGQALDRLERNNEQG